MVMITTTRRLLEESIMTGYGIPLEDPVTTYEEPALPVPDSYGVIILIIMVIITMVIVIMIMIMIMIIVIIISKSKLRWQQQILPDKAIIKAAPAAA